MSKRNHSRPITIGDSSPKDDPWLDKEIQKIRDQRRRKKEQANKDKRP